MHSIHWKYLKSFLKQKTSVIQICCVRQAKIVLLYTPNFKRFEVLIKIYFVHDTIETIYNKLKFYKSTSHPMAHHNIKRKVTTFYTTISLRTVSDQSSILIHFCVIPREAGTNLEFHFSEWHGLLAFHI